MTTQELNAALAGLTAFDGGAPQLPGLASPRDWAVLGEVVERHGLAPIVSYQLEYRWPGRYDVPLALRERLLSLYQGLLADNVYKLVQLKQLLSHEGMPEVVLLGAAAVADAFYPHIAFRPVPELELLVRGDEIPAAIQAFAAGNFRLQSDPQGARVAVGDNRLTVHLHRGVPGYARPGAATAALFERGVAALPYGKRVFRLAPEDAFLATVAALATEAFQVPRIQLVDLREMALRGARGGEGFWDPQGGAVLDFTLLASRVRDGELRRALACALQLLSTLFPEVSAATRTLAPERSARTKAALTRLVVDPALDPRRQSSWRGAQALRRVLLRRG
jgi:hypothetical protein